MATSKTTYYLKRTLLTVFMIWLSATAIFFLFRMLPGSYADILAQRGASESAIQAFRQKWGLDDPIYVEYGRFLWNYLHLDAGTSFKYGIPVVKYVWNKVFNTFILVAPALTFAYVLGVLLGTISGFKKGSKFEQITSSLVIFSGSFPSFYLALVLIVIFASVLNLFPTSGMVSVEVASQIDIWWRIYLTKSFAYHYFLPFAAIVLRYLFIPSLIMRTSVVETMGEDFIFYHRMTGLPKPTRLKHVAKHSILPVMTVYPATMTRAIGGLVLIESVFSWPGIGAALVSAVLARDFPVVQFIFITIATFVILANFVVDILYGVIDPRVSIES